MPSILPLPHAQFLEQLLKTVASDERFSAVLIGGSYVQGGLDQHSDLDFLLIVEDAHYPAVMASRREFAEQIDGLIGCFTGEHVGEPRLLICLYGPPLLHVDFKFTLASELDTQIERRTVLFARDPRSVERRMNAAQIAWPNLPPEWFEARAWIWLHYGLTKLQRGELYETIGMLGFFREQVLGPMLQRRMGKDQRGVRRLEALNVDQTLLVKTVAGHDADEIYAALRACIELYLDLRIDAPPVQPTPNMPGLLVELMEGSRHAAFK